MAKKVDLMRPIIFLCVVFLSLLSSFFPAAGQKSDPCYKNWVDSARNAIKVQNYRQAFDFYLDAFSEKSPKNPVHLYEAAVVSARTLHERLAFMFLNMAAERGFSYYEHASQNKDFPSLDEVKFKQCLERIKKTDSLMIYLTIRLDSVFEKDQIWRKEWTRTPPDSPDYERIRQQIIKVDSINLTEIEDIISEYGIWGQSLRSVGAQNAMFLVLQHAPLDIQEKYFDQVEDAVERGEIGSWNFALLIDRMMLRKTGVQKYGTQCTFVNGKAEVHNLIDSTKVDEYRKEMGLEPLSEYMDYMTQEQQKTIER